MHFLHLIFGSSVSGSNWSCLVPPLFKYDITPWIKEGPDQQHAMDIGFMCIGRCIRPHKSCNRGIVIMGCYKYIRWKPPSSMYIIYIHIDLHLKAILKGRWYHRDISAQLRPWWILPQETPGGSSPPNPCCGFSLWYGRPTLCTMFWPWNILLYRCSHVCIYPKLDGFLGCTIALSLTIRILRIHSYTPFWVGKYIAYKI